MVKKLFKQDMDNGKNTVCLGHNLGFVFCGLEGSPLTLTNL